MKNNQNIRLILKKFKRIEWSFILSIYVLVLTSLVFVYSSTLKKSRVFFVNEIKWIILGSIVFFTVSLIDYKKYAKYSKLIYIMNILLLLSVYLVGVEKLGATRWIRIGPLNIQPSEFAKLFVLLTFSELLTNGLKRKMIAWPEMMRAGFHIGIPFLLILKQPDLGTSLVLIFMYYILIFLSGVEWRPFLSLLVSNVAMAPVVFLFLKDYQKKRILVFLNPEADVLGSGWNVIQSIIAVGSGGITGKGILNGTQNKLKFLPESHTDFIFSVLAEETGFVGTSFLIIVYMTLIYLIIKVGQKSNDTYGQLIAYGIASIFFFHTIVNIGMVIGIMPVTGLPLLLMSYGGSSYLFSFMMLGIVQSIKIHGNN